MSVFPLSRFGSLAGYASTVLRLAVGPVMAAHGFQKFRAGPAGQFAGLLDQLGVPAPVVMAYLVTGLELVGGILLVVGLITRLWGLLIAAQMVITTVLVKAQVGLIGPSGGGTGAELDIALGAGALAIALLGPGKLALDRPLGIE